MFDVVNKVMLDEIVKKSIPERPLEKQEFYKKIENILKGKELEIYLKQYDNEDLTLVKGEFVEMEKNGKYIVVQSKSKETDFVFFAGCVDAVVAITNGHKEIIYGNKGVFNYSNWPLKSREDLERLRMEGKFNSKLFAEDKFFEEYNKSA